MRGQSAIGRTCSVEILQRSEDEDHVERLGGDVHPAIGQAQPHVNLGIEVLEGRNEGRNQALADPERGRDMQRAARLLRDVGDGCLRLLDRLEDLLRTLVEDRALFGRMQAAGRAVEEPDAEMTLQFGDAGRRDGGRDALIAPGSGHRAEFIDAQECAECVHIGHLCSRLAFSGDR